MLGKLMKYEFKATGRIFLPLFAALIILSGVNRLLSAIGLSAPFTIGAVVAGIMIASIFVLVVILTIQRFNQNLLSNEGHLMMTLPVKTDSIILSKMFTASIWSVACFIVAVLSIVIMASTGFTFADIGRFISGIFEELTGYALEATLITIESLVFIVLAVFSSVLTLYACISLSMLVNRRRGLFTFGAFIAVSTILQIVSAVVVTVSVALESDYRWLTNIFDPLSTSGRAMLVIAVAIVITALLSAVFYFTTRYMLKNRLNLQ